MKGSEKNRVKKIAKATVTALLSAAIVMNVWSAAYGEETTPHSSMANPLNDEISVDPTGLKEGFSAVLYDNSNGLPTSEANAITETTDGFIWIGSYAGLIRYDGNTFERMDSTGGLTSVKCLYADSKDRLWIGTNDNGVAVMEKGEIRKWGKLDGLKSAHTRAITEDENGTIYVATTCGIATIDKDYNLGSIEDETIAEANIRDIRMGADGILYATTDLGDLIVIEDGKLINYVSVEDNPFDGAGGFLPDPEGGGKIYHEGADFVFHHVDLSNGGFKEIEAINIDPLKYIRAVEYIDGKIWICAGNGIGVLDGDEFTVLDNLPMDNNVDDVMTDYLGNLWFTSTRQGVMKVVPNRFSDIFERYDLPETVVNSTCMYDGQLFVATDTGLIVLGENGPVSKVPLEKVQTASGKAIEADDLITMLAESRIRSIIKDSKDRMWISTWRSVGLLCYDHGTVTSYLEEDGMLSDNLRAVSEAEDGSILVAVTGGVNVIKDGAVVAGYTKDDGMDNTESLCVEEGLRNEILVGSNGGGLYVISESGTKNINVEDGLPSDIVMRMKRDTKHDLIWIVTSSAIAYMTPDYTVTTVKRFPYPNNFDLYENREGDIWVLSSDGIYVAPAEDMIDDENLNPVRYSKANGLPCITTANSYSDLTEDGDLYIAGSTGVAKVNIEQTFEDVNDLAAIVPYLEVDGNRVYPNASGNFTIPSDTKKLTVPSFVLNYSLSDPQVNYQLEGFDAESTTVFRSNLAPVDYTNLRGGSYNFVLQIKDAMGRGNKQVSVRIVKEKALHEQIWFIILAAVLILLLMAAAISFYFRRKVRSLEKKREEARELFEQTAEALSSAIDAKDKYTNGHSRRVAEYSLKIAKAAGLSEDDCEKVYFAGLLHDVGKIGVPIEILSKKGRLTDEEFEHIKQHPVVGGQILSNIRRSPWLSIGARYHHERYNGKGYPEGLIGEEIPEPARIIAVADAYDAMTSNRSYRNAIPQHIVREEIVKGIGGQFDPDFAKIMIQLIDEDKNYDMQEKGSKVNISTDSIRCDSLYEECTPGFGVFKNTTHVKLCSQPDDGVAEDKSLPTLILFDSLDGKVHPGEEENRNILYCEYARIRLDGQVTEGNVRKTKVSVSEGAPDFESEGYGGTQDGQRYEVDAVRYKDHARVTIMDEDHTITVILALPDTSRYLYLSIGGENCNIHNIIVENDFEEIGPDGIERIAEEISYIKDRPEGDIPNVQVDNWCTEYSKGIPVEKGLTLKFHARSLPTARLVWHCPFLGLYSSADGQVEGEDYHKYMLLMMDGESRGNDALAENELKVDHNLDFAGWKEWIERNKQGLDYSVTISREDNKIIMDADNQVFTMHATSTIREDVKEVYVALTGDQSAITDIRVVRDPEEG
ncbi:MAG: HD domain-containing protein [Lachnospiraceae bacterium]|nr:HD domain-containing protein [Lachnospiraceae bacterium]